MRRLLLASLLWLLSAGATSDAAVTVEDDEVIFTITAPDAGAVFLVGDFNNWNATLEKMDRTGDVFEVRLFLVPGTYRYGFVVDGKLIKDPDNPPAEPGGRSSVVLEMRAGMLALGGGEARTPAGSPAGLQPSLRYAGRFLSDDSESGSAQTVDVYVDYEIERMRANANLKATDDTWDLSRGAADIRLHSGYVDIDLDNLLIRGLENEDTWTASDPFVLLGDVGIYDYNAGLGRRGAALELGRDSRVQLKGLYLDRVESRPDSPISIPGSSLQDFVGSAAPDTSVYAYDTGFEDSDTWVIDLSADFRGLAFGYVARQSRGFQRGLLASIQRGSGDYTIEAFNSREDWGASATWLYWAPVDYLVIDAAWASGRAWLDQLTSATTTVTALGDITTPQDAAPSSDDLTLQKSRRWRGGIRSAHDAWDLSVTYDGREFDFEGIYDGTADINSVQMTAAYSSADWSVGLSAVHTVQHYRETPDDFHLYAPARNHWLDYGDDFTLVHIALFDLTRVSEARIEATWDGVDSTAAWGGALAHATFDIASNRVFETVEYLALRVAAEYRFPYALFAQADGRIAYYDKEGWGDADTYIAPYLEFGFRNARVEISLGLGVDPVVLNPVTNRYEDIGREEFIRRALPAVPRRSLADDVGAAALAREKDLEDEFPIKLEAIIRF